MPAKAQGFLVADLAVRRADPPQDLGVASQEARHEDGEHHEQQRLADDQRGHRLRPSSVAQLLGLVEAACLVTAGGVVDLQ